MEKGFCDVLVRNEGAPIFCYRSGMTVYEEGFSGGILSSFGWNGAGFTLNVLEDFPSYLKPSELGRSEVFSFEAGGQTLRNGWICDGYEVKEKEGGKECVLRLKSTLKPVCVKVHTFVDGTAVIERWLEIENVGTSDITIGNVAIMSGGLDRIEKWNEFQKEQDAYKLYSLGYFERAQHLNEGAFRWHDVTNVRHTISSRYERDRFRHPAFMLKNNAFGTIWFVQLAYSGPYAFDIDVNTDNEAYYANSTFRCRMDGDNPTYILGKGESCVTPVVHIGFMNGDLDDIVNEMHSHVRKSVFTIPSARGINGGLIEGGMGPERLMSVEASKHFIDTISAVGAETFIVDAGWYCPPGKATSEWWKRVGEWNYDHDLYPNGIEEVRSYAHSKGLLFGMWAERERAGEMSSIHANHPDWYIVANGVRTTVLDASNPEVIEFMEKSIEHLIEDYKIDLYRLDYNVDYKHWNYFNKKGENGASRYYENIYAMFKRLRAKYPDVVFENCASGGARTDLGFVQNFTHTWVSDHNSQPRATAITNGMTMVLPPEYVDRLASGMGSHQWGRIDAIVRHTLFGRPTTNDYNCVGSKMNPQQIEFVRHSYDIYKSVIRPFAPTGKIYHHTPEAYAKKEFGTLVLERSAQDKSAGVVGIFRTCGETEPVTVVYPKGVAMGALYEVTFDNSGETVTLSGYEMQKGIRVEIGSNMETELIIYRRK